MSCLPSRLEGPDTAVRKRRIFDRLRSRGKHCWLLSAHWPNQLCRWLLAKQLPCPLGTSGNCASQSGFPLVTRKRHGNSRTAVHSRVR